MMMDPFRIYLGFRCLQQIDQDITRPFLIIINNSIWLVIAASSYLSFFESEETFPDVPEEFTFRETIFFVMTSMPVVGYGSAVVTTAGRIFLIFMLSVVFIAIPDQSSKIYTLLSSKSIYERRKYKATENIPHIVLIGHVSDSAMFNFLLEYFHEDHTDQQRNCVIMLPQRPSADTEMRLMNKQYVSTVLYMEGNTLDHKDLKRCLIEKARTVVILSDKLTNDASSIDTHTIL
jgi:hypothetical protein